MSHGDESVGDVDNLRVTECFGVEGVGNVSAVGSFFEETGGHSCLFFFDDFFGGFDGLDCGGDHGAPS